MYVVTIVEVSKPANKQWFLNNDTGKYNDGYWSITTNKVYIVQDMNNYISYYLITKSKNQKEVS